MKKLIIFAIILIISILAILSYFFLPSFTSSKEPVYSQGVLEKPELSYSPLNYSFVQGTYNNPEYSLPLSELPENYQRDVDERFRNPLSQRKIDMFLNNGAIIVPGNEYDKFEDAFSTLSREDVPIFISSDSILHLYHIEFNEILKNLEIKKLSPMLNSFLDSLISETTSQYNGIKDNDLKELSRRNLAYLSVAKKLLDPNYMVNFAVSSDVSKEIERIEKHEGLFKSELFSKDCPTECLNLAFPEEKCGQAIKGLKISYEGKQWDSAEFYKEVCTRNCYCEDYSQYVPRGHYTSSEELKKYFKAMMWLGRMSFKARGDSWTKQAILLTDAIKSTKVSFEGKEYPAYEIWNKIYSITGFFAGASDDLTFYDYDNAVNRIFGSEFNEEEKLKSGVTDKVQEEISKSRGPKILGGFEIDIAGNLNDLTQGLRLIGQRYAIDSQVLGDLVYKNVGPNPNSSYYGEVIDYCTQKSCLGIPACSEQKDFYYSCDKMEANRTKYWNEVCGSAVELFCGCDGCSERTPTENIAKLWSVCRFMPTGLDVANVFGSKKAEEILDKDYKSGYCKYDEKTTELKNLVNSYSQENWTQNLYNTWLWMLQPVLKEKPEGYPSWMRSDVWGTKDLITSLSSWAELRHDTILYVKQSYTWAAATMTTSVGGPIEARYYGYVEPNPELLARAKFAVDFLKKGLEEQGVITEEVKNSLETTSGMMDRLKIISEKELRGENLTEDDYHYIENIDSAFSSILENLASALTVTEGSPTPGSEKETSLEGKDEAFKTSLIADVHTDVNSEKVLETGTGKIDWILVAHKSKEGRIGIAIGPIFSYYEFSWPMKDRLTDEKWRSSVLDNMERPIWYRDLIMESSKSPYLIKP
jgi:hypothetical protein